MTTTLHEMKPGIYRGMTFDDYLKIDAVSQSRLKHMDRSAKHCKVAMDEPEKPTKAMIGGKLFHTMKLESTLVPKFYAVMPAYELDEDNFTAKGTPTDSKATTYYKTRKAEFARANRDRQIIEEAEYDQVLKMVEALEQDPDAVRLFDRGGGHEAVVVWIDEPTGLLCKARIDCLILDAWATIVDLKRAANADNRWHNGLKPFPLVVGSIGYDVQAAFYADGVTATSGVKANFIVVAVENNAACGVGIYDLTDVQEYGSCWADVGRRKYRRWLTEFSECKRTGIWPNYKQGIRAAMVPAYELDHEEGLVT